MRIYSNIKTKISILDVYYYFLNFIKLKVHVLTSSVKKIYIYTLLVKNYEKLKTNIFFLK